jgi:hypothetical protein
MLTRKILKTMYDSSFGGPGKAVFRQFYTTTSIHLKPKTGFWIVEKFKP